MRVVKVLGLLLALLGSQHSLFSLASGNDDDYALIWTSLGAGYRAMPFLVGYANVFYQAGLINHTYSKFYSVSHASSAEWFAAQFFYSQQFFDRTVAEDPQDVYDFVVKWYESYGRAINPFGDLIRRGFGSTLAEVIFTPEASIYIVLKNMLEEASKDYGDPDFTKRLANYDNRIPAMNNTEMYLSAALSPVSRIRKGLLRGYSLTYIGPSDSDDVYSVPIAYQYAVKKNYTKFFAGVEQSSLPIRTCVTRNAPRTFRFSDWSGFPMFPDNKENLGHYLTSKENTLECIEEGYMSEPFGGKTPTTLQAAMVGSLVWTEYSPLTPASLAQTMSFERHVIRSSDQSRIRKAANDLYLLFRANFVYRLADRFLELGWCLQNPAQCGSHDAFVSHTGNPDENALALAVGQYQTHGEGDKSKTLKVIVNSHVTWNRGFMAYFNTTFTQNVEPGGYVWTPRCVNPWRSVQIFDDYLDQETLDSMRDPVPGTMISTIRFNLTTIDNPSVFVQAGQRVEILLLIANNEANVFPIVLVTQRQVEELKETCGQTAKDIAASEELVRRIKDFVDS